VKEGEDQGIQVNQPAFKKLVSQKYFFPLAKLTKSEWLEELQKPLQIQAEDILKDLYKFVKDFPVQIIPHMSEIDIRKLKEMQKAKLEGESP